MNVFFYNPDGTIAAVCYGDAELEVELTSGPCCDETTTTLGPTSTTPGPTTTCPPCNPDGPGSSEPPPTTTPDPGLTTTCPPCEESSGYTGDVNISEDVTETSESGTDVEPESIPAEPTTTPSF